MTVTKKLYDDAPYETTFAATVCAVSAAGSGWEVVLDQTLFFPEEGGQDADTGLLSAKDAPLCASADGGWRVTDVQIQEGIIRHHLEPAQEKTPPREGMRLQGIIDWAHRFSNMQNHTGEHILSGLIHQTYGFDNVGFHLSRQTVTLDQSGYLTPAQLKAIEQEANRVVWANVPVTAAYFPQEEAAERTYRSKTAIAGAVRLVTIAGVDVCACCAPHVAHTGEIGQIRILRSEKYKGGVRVTFVCGDRALAQAQQQHAQAEQISRLLRVGQADLHEGVQHLYEENAAQKERLIRLQEEAIQRIAKEARKLRRATKEAEKTPHMQKEDPAAGYIQEAACPDAPGQDIICDADDNVWIFAKDLDALPHRNLVNLLTACFDGFAGVFLPAKHRVSDGMQADDMCYRYIIGSREKDARAAGDILRAQLGAKGGGKADMIQGSVTASKEALLSVLGRIPAGGMTDVGNV